MSARIIQASKGVITMDLYQFISETEIKKFKDGDFIVKNDSIVHNPGEEELRSIGFKPLVRAKRPLCNKRSHMLVKKYVEGEESITERFEVLDNSEFEIRNS